MTGTIHVKDRNTIILTIPLTTPTTTLTPLHAWPAPLVHYDVTFPTGTPLTNIIAWSLAFFKAHNRA